MTHKSLIIPVIASLALTFAAVASAEPTTQACLGDLDKLLTCAPGHKLFKPSKGEAGGAMYCVDQDPNPAQWPPYKRQGPSVWYYSKHPEVIQRSGNYRDHKKHGRHYDFNEQGVLDTIADWKDGKRHGMYIYCRPDGSVHSIVQYSEGKLHGLSRHWEPDGTMFAGTEYKDGKAVMDAKVQSSAPPPGVCQLRVCDLNAPIGSLPRSGK